MPKYDPPVRLNAMECFAVSTVLWNIANDKDVPHDRKVDAIFQAGFLQLEVGMPGWPTDNITNAKAAAFFEWIAASVDAMTGPAPPPQPLPTDIVLRDPCKIVEVLWDVIADETANYSTRVHSAYIASIITPKILPQLVASDRDEDVELLRQLSLKLKQYAASLLAK